MKTYKKKINTDCRVQ